MPTSQINAAGQTILKLFPLPNAVDATGNRLYNALYQFVQDNPRSNKILRVDYNLGSKTTVYGRLLNSYQDSNGYGVATAAATYWPQMLADNSTRAAGAVGTVIHIFRPNLINELTWGINYSLEEISATAAEMQKYTLTGAGLGATVPELYPQANPLNLLPTTSFGAGSGGGIINNAAAISFEARFPYFGTDSIQNLVESVSLVEGKHNTKFGVYYEHVGRNSPHSNAVPIGTLNFGSSNLNPLDSGWGLFERDSGNCAAILAVEQEDYPAVPLLGARVVRAR